MEWSTDFKNGYGDLEVYMEYGVQLAEIMPKWRVASLNKVIGTSIIE